MATHSRPDVFLSHNSSDKTFVMQIKEELQRLKITSWIDKDDLPPGRPWQPEIAKAIKRSKSVAVFVGASGLGQWQDREVQHALSVATGKKKPVIGVLIPGAPKEIGKSALPWTVKTRTVVDMREGITPDSIERLRWGITGKKRITAPSAPDPNSGVELSAADSWLEERVIERLKANGQPLLDAYAELFSVLSTDRNTPVTFESILNRLESKQQDKRTIASVSGFAGTGKSTFLICLHYAQMLRYESKQSPLYPIFVNLRSFLSRCDSEPQSCPAVARDLGLFVDRCIQGSPAAREGNILLIVDGCDEYYRHRAQSEIDTTLQDKLEKMIVPGKVVKVVGVGHGNEAFPGFVPTGTLKRFFPTPLIDLRPVRVDDPDLRRLIHEYVHVNGHDNESDMVQKIERLIEALDIPEVDLFILSLLEAAVRTRSNPVELGIGSLYFDSCLDRVRKVGREFAHTHETARRLIKILAEMTFQIYVPDVKEFDQVVRDTALKYPDVGAVLPAMIAEIPHLHTSVKEFLIAENAIELILSRSMPLEPNDGAIYPYGINRFIKSIINRSVSAQNEILSKVEAVIFSAHIRQQIHLSYILGRFKDRHVRQIARNLLNRVFSRIKGKGPDLLTLSNPVKSVEARNWLLLKRTIYISLIYLGDQDAATAYLMEMLEYPVCDNLNRGFHIQYYQDLTHPPTSLDMIEPDALDVEPLKTFDVLLEKLQFDISRGKPRPMSCVELFTLCSLCVNRHIIGELTSSRLRERLAEFLMPLKAEDLDFPKEAWAYIEMARDLISRESVNAGQVFHELHALKEQPRAGWNATHIINGVPHERHCAKPESVSDHIWGTMMIASAFLPEHPPEDDEHRGYSKSRIVLMLMIHDLAEAYLGDKPSFLKTDEDKAAEDRRMARIIALSTLDVFNGVLSWRGLWSEWRSKAFINARIASDIDAIESYLQMRRYLTTGTAVIPDADAWTNDVMLALNSTLGKRIFASLR